LSISVFTLPLGRYNKYSRELSQSPWLIDGVRRGDTSVSELICQPLEAFTRADCKSVGAFTHADCKSVEAIVG